MKPGQEVNGGSQHLAFITGAHFFSLNMFQGYYVSVSFLTLFYRLNHTV